MFSSKKLLFLSLKLFSSFLCLMFFNCLCYGENYDLKDEVDDVQCGYWQYNKEKDNVFKWNYYLGINLVKENILHLTAYDGRKTTDTCRAVVSSDTKMYDPSIYWPNWAPSDTPVNLSTILGEGLTHKTLSITSTLQDNKIFGIGGPWTNVIQTGTVKKIDHSCKPTSTFKLLDLKTFTSLKAIGAASFQNRKVNGKYEVTNDAITSLTIPNKCHYIGKNAFKGNVCLKTVKITCPTLDHIETTSFADCDNIEQFSFSMSSSQSDFVNNLKNGTTGTLITNSVQAFARYYYNKGYTVSTSSTGKTLYIKKTSINMANLGQISKTISNQKFTLSAKECSLDLTNFGTGQGKPTSSKYELYVRTVLKEGNSSSIGNWVKSNSGCSLPCSKPGIYQLQYAIISKNPAFKSTHNELKNENNHLIYKDENGKNVDLGEVESQ